MKTLQIKTGRWYAMTGPDGSVTYMPAVPGMSPCDVARETERTAPLRVTEVMGTGIRLHDAVQQEGDEWTVYGNNAQALSAAAFRIRETA